MPRAVRIAPASAPRVRASEPERSGRAAERSLRSRRAGGRRAAASRTALTDADPSVKRSTSRLKNAPNAERPTMRITRTPAAATRTKSTSFARAAGRPRSTFIAASSPSRIEAIIPDAPQERHQRDQADRREWRGDLLDRLPGCCPGPTWRPGGRISSSMTCWRSSSSWSTRPKTETSAIVSGKSEKSTR